MILLKLEFFRYLETIERFGTISTAAEELHMSRQSLHAAINQLEDELGVPLLKRQARGVVLTEEGKQACEIAQDCQRKLCQLKTSSAPIKGTLHVSGTQVVLSSYLSEILSTLHRDYPLITLKTTISDIDDIINKYTAHEIDLGFIALSKEKIQKLEQKRPDLQVVPFGHYEIGVRLAKTSLWAKHKCLSSSFLKNVQVLYNCTEEHALKQAQYELFRPSNQTKTIFEPIHSVYKKMIINEMGVGIEPILPPQKSAKEIAQASESIVCIPFQDVPKQYVAYLVDATTPFSAQAMVFLNLINYLFTDD